MAAQAQQAQQKFEYFVSQVRIDGSSALASPPDKEMVQLIQLIDVFPCLRSKTLHGDE